VLDLDQLDLRIGQSRIQGNLESGGGRVRAAATMTDLPLAMLAALGAPELNGVAAASLRLDGPLAAPRVDLDLDVPELRPGGRGSEKLPAAAVKGNARVADGRLRAELRIEQLSAQPITASLLLPMTFALEPLVLRLPPEGRLDGRVAGDLDLALLGRYAALDGQRLEGGMSVALDIGGSIAAPSLRGRIEAGPAQIEDAVTGMLVRDARLVIAGEGSRVRIEQLSARTRGDGSISGKGELRLDEGMAHELELVFRNAEVLRSDLGAVILSGDLGLDGDSAAGRLAGRLEVQRADLQIPSDLGRSIPDLQVVETRNGASMQEPTRRAPPYDLTLDLALDAPARLFIRGRGLDSEWGGRLTAKGPASEAQVLGELTFRRGFLDFLDRRFTIRKGVIAFSGARPPVPEIDLEAAADGRTIVALVQIIGPATAPELKLTSEPELPQDEVLAQLLFDRDMSQITPAQGVRLAAAVRTLEGKGIDLVGEFRRKLGLDTLDVGGEGAADANLRAGKYLADNVYIEMQQGVQAGSGKARIEVELTPHIAVGTEVDEESRTSVGVEWKLDY
jgi:translocation and assembly module TamB